MRVRSVVFVSTIIASASCIVSACDDYGTDDPVAPPSTDSGTVDATDAEAETATAVDAGSGCSQDAPFARSKGVPGLAVGSYVGVPRLTHDELQIFFGASVDGGVDLYVASRTTRDLPFGAREPVNALNTTDAVELDPSISADARTMFFGRAAVGSTADIWVATRANPLVAFGTPAPFAGNTGESESTPYVLAGADVVYFTKTVGSAADIHRAVVGPGGSVTSAPVPGINGPAQETNVVVASDERTVYFASDRNSAGSYDIFVAHRGTRDEDFGMPTEVGELNSTSSEWPGWISPDGCRLYYLTGAEGAYELRIAERER